MTTEDRFYHFVTSTFPEFSRNMSSRLTGVETEMKGVHGRLKKIEGRSTGTVALPSENSNGMRAALIKCIPWLVMTLVAGAALGGAIIGGAQ